MVSAGLLYRVVFLLKRQSALGTAYFVYARASFPPHPPGRVTDDRHCQNFISKQGLGYHFRPGAYALPLFKRLFISHIERIGMLKTFNAKGD